MVVHQWETPAEQTFQCTVKHFRVLQFTHHRYGKCLAFSCLIWGIMYSAVIFKLAKTVTVRLSDSNPVYAPR